MQSTSAPAGDLLEIDCLTKTFDGLTAVDCLSFRASAGEVFGLLGPNGAGKTTTIRLISTVLAPTSGTARVCGFDVRRKPEEVRRRIGMLTTDMGVYDRLTGREYLRYFGSLHSMAAPLLERRISELARLLEMEDFLDRRAGAYSTGMKQKLSIARCVLHDPPIVILDEPTSGLDVLASQTVLNFMRRTRDQGKLVILSTHHMPDAERLCDRAAILHQGRLLVLDSVAGLKQKTGTDNLEDAFLALVKSSPEEARPRHRRQEQKPGRRWLRIVIAVLVAMAIVLWQRLQG